MYSYPSSRNEMKKKMANALTVNGSVRRKLKIILQVTHTSFSIQFIALQQYVLTLSHSLTYYSYVNALISFFYIYKFVSIYYSTLQKNKHDRERVSEILFQFNKMLKTYA